MVSKPEEGDGLGREPGISDREWLQRVWLRDGDAFEVGVVAEDDHVPGGEVT